MVYPRLIVTIDVNLNPVDLLKHRGVVRNQEAYHPSYSLGAITGRIAIDNHVLADSVVSHAHSRAISINDKHNGSDQWRLEFPLDVLRIEHIEKVRAGGDFTFDLTVTVQVHLFSNGGLLAIDYSRDIISRIVVPQSHWAKSVLPNLGHSKYLLVEIPDGQTTLTIASQWIDKAQSAYTNWDYPSVSAHAREAGKVLNKHVTKQLDGAPKVYSQQWNRAYDNFSHLASLTLHSIEHLGDYPDSSVQFPSTVRVYADHILVSAKLLVKLADALIRRS